MEVTPMFSYAGPLDLVPAYETQDTAKHYHGLTSNLIPTSTDSRWHTRHFCRRGTPL